VTAGPEPEPRTAVVLVRSSAAHDSRVLREALTLRGLGFQVLLVEFASENEPLTEPGVDGIRVVRVSPERPLRRLARGGRPEPAGAPAGAVPTAHGDGPPKAEAPGRGTVTLAPLRRFVGRHAYALHAIPIVLRARPALVHANDYITMWIGVAAKLLRASRLVYDAHELWPDRNGRTEWRPRLLAGEWLFVRLADANLTVSPGCAKVMAARYRIAPPLVVRNVAERNVAAQHPPEGLRAGRPPLAVYVGLIAPGRGLEQAIHALAAVPEARLRLLGRSSHEYRELLTRLAAEAGVADRIEYRPPVQSSAVIDTIAGADMGLALIQPVSLSYEQSLPNKLFEYAAAGLPILASDLPVMGPLVREEGLGEAVPVEDVAAIAQAIRRLADPRRNAEVRERVRAFRERVNWQTERQILEQVYASLVGADSHASV
jgi:glycosyltransferase involved in cell wall biosynthesis